MMSTDLRIVIVMLFTLFSFVGPKSPPGIKQLLNMFVVLTGHWPFIMFYLNFCSSCKASNNQGATNDQSGISVMCSGWIHLANCLDLYRSYCSMASTANQCKCPISWYSFIISSCFCYVVEVKFSLYKTSPV